MADLPLQGKITVPVDWQGTTQKTTTQAAGYQLSTTIGWRPYSQSATLQWVIDKADAADLIYMFEATNFNGVFDYNCLVKGPIKVRLTGDFSYSETRHKSTVTVGVTRV